MPAPPTFRLAYAWERVMTLFLPTLVSATNARATTTATRIKRDDDDDDDEQTSSTPLGEALRAIDAGEMTRVFAFAGSAMAPSLGVGSERERSASSSSSSSSSSNASYALARRLAYPFRSAAIGDVVAFAHPTDTNRTLIRRVTAVEGDELVDATNASVYVVPRDHAWVTADAEDERHEDSRSFGPVDMRAIEWRVIYSLRTAVDHGEVENNAGSRVADAPVLEAELENAKRRVGFLTPGEDEDENEDEEEG
jgi:signal peptidase I